MSNLNVALTLSLNDRLVAPLQRALAEVQKGVQAIEKDLLATNKASGQANSTMANMRGPEMAAKQAAELARNTQNAVGLAERLKTAFSGVGNVIKGVAAGAAGFQAAKFVMAAPMQEARTYDRQLRDLGNTAYGDLSGDKFTAKIGGLNKLLETAVREGGGTREGAVGAASTLMAQGGLSEVELAKVMPTIMKAATAANADAKDIANVVAAAIKNGFNPDQISTMIGKAIASGQAGGFEMKDMAKWLPKLLAAGSTIGMTGMKDYEEILAMAQVSRTTAGGSDEAGNNLLNFLLKVNSSDTQVDAKKQGIDLSGTLAKNRDAGMTASSAFIGILRSQMDKDPRIIKLRSQFAGAANDSERTASLKAQESIFAGSAMGKFLQDRQALMPAIAAINNPAELKKQLAAVQAGGTDTTQRAFGNIADGADFKTQQKENEKLFALTDGLNPVNTALAKLSDHTTELYRKYPGYATVVELGKWALGGIAAAAVGAGGALAIFGLALKKQALEMAVPGGVGKPGALVPAATGLAAAAPVIATGLVAGGLVLGAGYAMSEAMNTPGAINSRVDSRNDRLAELTELVKLTKDGGGSTASLEKEMTALRTDRDNLLVKLVSMDEVARELRALNSRPVQLVVNGDVLANSVGAYHERHARRN